MNFECRKCEVLSRTICGWGQLRKSSRQFMFEFLSGIRPNPNFQAPSSFYPVTVPLDLKKCDWSWLWFRISKGLLTPVPVAERSKARVYVRSLAGIAGSNPAGGMDGCPLWVLCVLSGRSLCDRPIPRPEESYWLWCVLVCDLVTSRMRRLKLVRVVNAG